MGIQNELNRESIRKLPRICELIKKADFFESNQMINYTLKSMINYEISIDKSSKKELEIFEKDLILSFEYYKWIN